MPDHTPTVELSEPAQDGTMTLPIPGSAADIEGAQAGDLSETGVLADHAPRFSLLHIALFCILLTGFLLRLSAAKHLSSHVDESASIMAAKMVADRGVPIFPSGTLDLQGATLSYILAPIIKLGYGGFDDLFVMRMLSVITGTLAILALYFLTKWLTRSAWTGAGVAMLLALDPASIRWSGLVRMYATLQLATLVMLFLFLVILRFPASRRMLISFVAVFWFGVFTHIAIGMFVPPMVILAVWKHRMALIGKRLDLTLAFGAAMVAPITLLGLNRLISPRAATPAGTKSAVGFVGDFLFSFDQLLAPTVKSWRLLFAYADSGSIIPALIVGISVLLAGRYFLDANLPDWKRERRNVFGTIMLLYWLPILMVAAAVTESNERYLLHLHPLGLILIGFAVQELVGGELKAPAQVYAPASPQRMRIGGREIDLVGGEFGQQIAWLTTSRLVTGTGVLIIALGGILRLWRYTFWGMWLDEGFALLYSQQSWRSVVGLNGFYSPHPPLYFTLTKVFNEVIPDATAGRTVSVLCGILVLPVFYLLARRILDPVASLVATLVFALSPIHLYYSQEARMYALVVFSVTLAYLALVAFIQTHSKWWAALYALALIIAVYGDYSSLFALAPQAFILLWYIGRDWRKMIPILVAGGLAILAYAPWLPQVFHSVNSANEDERRQDYLGAGFGRVMTLSLRITGFSSDQFGPYFPSLNPTAWDSFAELRSLMVLGMAPVVVLGFVGLWRHWTAMAITFSFLGSIAVTALVSFISPSFAERSILCAAVGWSLLLGAAFNGRIRRDRTPFAALSLIFVLLICLTTVSNIYTYGLKSRWDDAAADLAYAEPLQFPVITYSYGEVANTLVEAYEPGLLNRERLITVRDGVLEKTLSNDILPHTGITVADVDAGELKTLLPETAENDYVWFLYYQRIGQENVELGIQDAGYVRIIEKTYVSPRNQVFLDLYARPDAATSVPITSLQPFTSGDAWGIPANAPLVKASADGTAVSIQNQSKLGTAIATQVSISGPALVVFNADVETLGSGKAAQVILRCLSGTGVVLNESTAVTPGRRNLLHHRSAIVCPEDTQQIRITLLNLLTSEQTWSNISAGMIPMPSH